uniref:ABC transmembrane type-1 domain-containing protein n=1 Tax=Panagrolaimus sp. PS1159 TaxID=55785 RepID=A0AC35FVD0_9BILA
MSTKSAKNKKEAIKMIQEEFAASGRVNPHIYYSYFKAMGILLFLLFIAFFIGNSIATVGRSLWLSDWSDETINNGTSIHMSSFQRLGIYGLIGILETICLFLANVFLVTGGINASLNLHNPLINNLLRSPLQFFDTTPLGRILNRTGKVSFIRFIK